jgi:hypothetical protein
MTSEREKLIRKTWDRVAARAMGSFRTSPAFIAQLQRPIPTVVGADVPLTYPLDEWQVRFVLERTGPPAYLERVVCEGVVVEGPQPYS